MDSIPGARMLCIHDHEGNLLEGKPPPADPPSWFIASAEFAGYVPPTKKGRK